MKRSSGTGTTAHLLIPLVSHTKHQPIKILSSILSVSPCILAQLPAGMFSSPQRQRVMMPLTRMTWQGTCVQRRRDKEPLMSPCYDSFSFYSSIQNPKHFSSFHRVTCLSGRASDKSEAMIDGAPVSQGPSPSWPALLVSHQLHFKEPPSTTSARWQRGRQPSDASPQHARHRPHRRSEGAQVIFIVKWPTLQTKTPRFHPDKTQMIKVLGHPGHNFYVNEFFTD